MVKKSFIFGATDLGLLLYRNLLGSGDDSVAAFIVDKEFKTAESLLGLPVIESDKMSDIFAPEEYGCYLCIGYNNMNAARRKVYDRLSGAGYRMLNFIHPSARALCDAMGNGNIIFHGASIDFFTEIGNGNILYPGASIAHHDKIGNFNFFSVSSCVAGHVRIGDMNFIGANATIGNDISLEDGCLVGAGAYLPQSMKSYEVFAPRRGMLLDNKKSVDFFYRCSR